MRKARLKAVAEQRPEYERSDFGTLVRGKYAARIAAATNIVILEPEVAKVFPNPAEPEPNKYRKGGQGILFG
jgi:hypothetical protein